VRERAVRLAQLDRDLAGLVVGLDAGDVTFGLARVDVVLGALDHQVERRAARLQVEHPLDRVLEVGGLDGRAVRVLEALPQRQLVGQAVLGDGRHLLGEAGNQL
jgi:hypothetical protein